MRGGAKHNWIFTAEELTLADQSCAAESLAKQYRHLRGVPQLFGAMCSPCCATGLQVLRYSTWWAHAVICVQGIGEWVLSYIIPFTMRAKVLVQALWQREQGWDKPIPDELLPAWFVWERELPLLPTISLPRCYLSAVSTVTPVDLHIFSDASKRAQWHTWEWKLIVMGFTWPWRWPPLMWHQSNNPLYPI